MTDKVVSILMKLLVLGILLGIGAIVSWIFYYFKKRELFGGFIGGMVVGVLGALLGAFVLDNLLLEPVTKILKFLVTGAGVNIIAGFIGAYIAISIMNWLNHNKERKKF